MIEPCNHEHSITFHSFKCSLISHSKIVCIFSLGAHKPFVKFIPVYLYIYIYFFFKKLINLFIFDCVGSLLLSTGFLWLRQVGATLCCGAQASHCSGFSCCGAWALGARASVIVALEFQSVGSVIVVHGLSCSAACGIFMDQSSNPCPLHWQADT